MHAMYMVAEHEIIVVCVVLKSSVVTLDKVFCVGDSHAKDSEKGYNGRNESI